MITMASMKNARVCRRDSAGTLMFGCLYGRRRLRSSTITNVRRGQRVVSNLLDQAQVGVDRQGNKFLYGHLRERRCFQLLDPRSNAFHSRVEVSALSLESILLHFRICDDTLSLLHCRRPTGTLVPRLPE